MDTPVVSSLFRALSRHRSCIHYRLYPTRFPPNSNQSVHRHHRRGIFTIRDDAKKAAKQGEWQQKSPFLHIDMSEEFKRYPMVTAAQLALREERPRRVKMLVRDFIDDSLYNPQYGYFSKHAVIFSPSAPFEFPAMKDALEFDQALAAEYTRFEDRLDSKASEPSLVRQLWHTPTELFKPHYGDALARYLVTNYKLSLYPYHDLIIYEMGAGTGTMMTNILNHIHDTDPDIYTRTQYRTIEISPSLANLQRTQAAEHGHAEKIEIINQSIFAWDQYASDPCFFLALEVFDNFSHDMLRYDVDTGQPLQGIVLIDDTGDFHDFYVPQLDPIVARFLKLRRHVVQKPYPHPLSSAPPLFIRDLKARLLGNEKSPVSLTKPEFVPTKMMLFFDVLRNRFPAHRLIMSDFCSLPDAIEGFNAPVVQTRFERESIAVTTPFVQQGYFDILFPTDFEVMDDMYKALTGKLTRVMKHEEFMSRWADLEETETRSGENPLLQWYKNVSMMSSV